MKSAVGAPPRSSTDQVAAVQSAVAEMQCTVLELQQIAATVREPSLRECALSLQVNASEVLARGLEVQQSVLGLVDMQGSYAEALSLCTEGSRLMEDGNPSGASDLFQRAIQLAPTLSLAYKALGDCFLQQHEAEAAAAAYSAALNYQPHFPEAENNLAIAYLGAFSYDAAQSVLTAMLRREHGLPEKRLGRFTPEPAVTRTVTPCFASPFKLTDRVNQLTYLLQSGRIHPSFEGLVSAYQGLLNEIENDSARAPYTALTDRQLAPFGGYFDKLLHFEDAPRLSGAAVNPTLDFTELEKEYESTRCIYFDDLLTPEALRGLRDFFLNSTVFFRHSEAGFVGSYVTEGFCCSLVFQILEELRKGFPRLLGDKPLNNMWCYRYGSQGSGVKPHNGDGSVTINFYLTPDEANVGNPNGGGMVMYDKVHPAEWDWLTFNMYKDDPGIQAQIAGYLADARADVVPYRCNRAVMFHSTLFHKTDPFHFRDDYESRRMNITMLFGQRSQESATLR